ncbi:plant UBX domain-containing protein 10-like [Andrographis paniculata]|uniref:plant UBX domain-containing protein 10-like n=1 Tax=Andrographis paniculata TaxID=175694 RepID=UPI0021E7DF28|nr:plant UBX domain-containing protein 10-like [Andrographis paniculata]
MSSPIEELYSGIVRKIIKLPQNILGEVSRAMNHGKTLIGFGNNHHHQQISHAQQFPTQDPSAAAIFPQIQEEWAFLATFEPHYGNSHPFFYACRFSDALRIARDERKLVFMYIHSPENPYTPCFCRDTLCAEVVMQFLDVNFVCWGGLASRGDGRHLATALRASMSPFCAVVAPVAGDNLEILQQIEGPVSPAELVEILQRTMEEQGPAFGSERANRDTTRREDRRLREEQDAAYKQALQIDQSKERFKKNTNSRDSAREPRKPKEGASAGASQRAREKGEETQILIRFPNGERREQSFLSTNKIRAIYKYIDDLLIPGVGSYRLISNFPRKVYGADHMEMSLKDAGLNAKASLFLEPL